MNNDQKEENSVSVTKPKSTVLQKIGWLGKTITVEPLIIFYQMGIYVSKPALDNMELEKACRVVLTFNDSICDAILAGNHREYTNENNAMQIAISKMHSWQLPMQSCMPLVLGLFLGSFSDRYKLRKPFYLLPVLGEILGIIGCILCAVYMRSWSLNIQGLFQKVVPSFFGGGPMMIMATTAYIADISTVNTRTFRLGVVQLFMSTSSPIVNSFSAILFLHIGYYGILNVSLLFLLIAFCYGLFFTKEYQTKCDKPLRDMMADLFDIKYPLDTLRILFKESPGVSRSNFLKIVAMVIIHRAANSGETNILYLYTQNVFQWTPVQFSFFLTVSGLVLLAGNAVSLPLFTRIVKLADPTILFLTIFSKILSNFVFGFATTPEIFYTGIIAGIITRMYRVAKKSLLTKVVREEDIGKTQSLFSIFEAVAPAVSVPLFNLIYVNTLVSYPSTFFFFGIILYGTCCVLILSTYQQLREKEKEEIPPPPEKNIETLYI